jgi:hypothetical protein
VRSPIYPSRDCWMPRTSLWTRTKTLGSRRSITRPSDAHLIGLDPEHRIHISDRLLEIHDGPFLELGLKGIAGTLIDRPRRLEDLPDRDPLALEFGQFKKSA